jgi:ribosomal protein S12 methylthiotransferase accessory factor YcaO
MTWPQEFPAFIAVVIGLGAMAIAINAIITLYKSLKPKDIERLDAELRTLRDRLGDAERSLARIDTDAIAARFDRLEGKFDELTAILLKSLASRGV